jgi:hypothetical protein
VTPEIALINAIRAKLKASNINEIGDKVFDQVPDVKPPYIYIGPAGRRRMVTECYQAWTQRVRTYIVYTTWNRTQVWETAETVIQLLDLIEFELAMPYVQAEALNIVQADDVIDPNAPKSVFVDLQTTITRVVT